AAEAYAAGCRAAACSLLLALGFSPEPREAGAIPRGVLTQLWLLEDLENLIVSVYSSMLSVPPQFTSPDLRSLYRKGFGQICQDLLLALGSSVQLEHPGAPHRNRIWKEETHDPAEG
ncbi:MAG: hypothetical protein ACP5SI_12810, partial [Chloroflexia bacterium]